MTPAEKIAIRQAQRGDKRSMEKLITNYKGLIESIAYKMKHNDSAYNQDDLDQLATRGFIEAVKRFNFLRGTELSTYAVPWIKKFLRESIKIGEPVFEIDDNRLTYEDEFGSKLKILTNTNLLPQDRTTYFYAHNLLDKLSASNKQIVKDYYGIKCEKPLNVEEIAHKHNVDIDIIRDIIQDSIKFLRK